VNGLYEYHTLTSSAQSLDLLIGVNEPHDRFLCDKICEGLKAGGRARLNALSVLGYVIRKQPPWLYRLTHNALMKELVKVLKTEEDLVIMMSALLDVLTLMPILPTYVAPYLHDLFEVFR
jgi:tuberous sclerosis protein 1